MDELDVNGFQQSQYKAKDMSGRVQGMIKWRRVARTNEPPEADH